MRWAENGRSLGNLDGGVGCRVGEGEDVGETERSAVVHGWPLLVEGVDTGTVGEVLGDAGRELEEGTDDDGR
jgi:hypothetical protein